MLDYLSAAIASFASVEVLLALIVGVVGGMVIGIIPGLGPSVGIALLLPISFSMSPTAALVMMTAMYTTGVYGGFSPPCCATLRALPPLPPPRWTATR